MTFRSARTSLTHEPREERNIRPTHCVHVGSTSVGLKFQPTNRQFWMGFTFFTQFLYGNSETIPPNLTMIVSFHVLYNSLFTNCPPLNVIWDIKLIHQINCIYKQYNIYRVSQEECARVRESVPYVKVYRYNPKQLYPKLNVYGDNGQRSLKLWQLLHTYWLPNTY